MHSMTVATIHNCKELLRLKRKAPDEIQKTIIEQQKKKEGNRSKCTREEYLTRRIARMKYLLDKTELVLFDQYPLSKYPNKQEGGQRADIVYAYRMSCQQPEWSIGIVEAKVEGGTKLKGTIEEVKKYICLFNQKITERLEALRCLATQVHNIEMGNNMRLCRIDILATKKWWADNKKDWTKIREEFNQFFPNLELRALTVNDDYLTSENINIGVLS